jgi:hypothetical protein
MTKKLVWGLTVSALLVLTACTEQVDPQTGRIVFSVANPSAIMANSAAASSPAQRRALIDITAKRLSWDRQSGGMAGLVSDLEACYRRASDSHLLQDCVALDMAAIYVSDMTWTFHHFPPLPYLSGAAWQDRMDRYGSRAFGSEALARAFMNEELRDPAISEQGKRLY